MATEPLSTHADHRQRYNALLADLAAASAIPAVGARQLAFATVVFRSATRLAIESDGMPADVRIGYEHLRDVAKRGVAQCGDEMSKQLSVFEVRR